ncbi:hypothetical protein [Alteromonas aestuariivivens]|nr:hypothetical protein [Alteromonas aestuariivivens]
MASDRIEYELSLAKKPVTWVKMTTISFTWQEVAEVYSLQGYQVFPLLIVRNPFDAWVSLKSKWYGLNSTTAEDPPLILRFRRFLRDWEWFVSQGHPIINFETFVANPKDALQEACKSLPIDYHEFMTEGETKLKDIAYVSESNQSFLSSLTKGVSQQIASKTKSISSEEAQWLTSNFSEIITAYGYQNHHHVHDEPSVLGGHLVPHPFDSRRYLGFGPQASLRRVSDKFPELIKCCSALIDSGVPIAIYGSGEFAQYLNSVLSQNNIKVECFYDSFLNVEHAIHDVPVRRYSATSRDQFIIIASFKNAQSIASFLSSKGVSAERVYTFLREG